MPLRYELPESAAFIGAWFLDDLSVCDALISVYRNSPDRAVGVTTDRAGINSIDRTVKDSEELHFPPDSPDPSFQAYVAELQKVVLEYISIYPYCDRYAPWTIIQKTNLQGYLPGGGYKSFHTERVSAMHPNTSRHLVFMTYLNDVTDRGETEFFHQKLLVPPKRGLTLIWPADWTHTHRGVVSPTQEKIIITGWFNFVLPAAG